jgi:hypothetical protein
LDFNFGKIFNNKTMKIFHGKISYIAGVINLFLFIFAFQSCSDKSSGSKVSVEEGFITINKGDSTINYKIDEITYVVSNDTTTLEITAVNSLSSDDYLVVGLRNMVPLSTKEYSFKNISDSSSVYLYFVNNNSKPTQIVNGTLKVLKYNQNDIFQAKFSYAEGLDSIIVKGQINLGFAMFDSYRVPNVPISPGTLKINIDSVGVKMSCVAIQSSNQFVINGVGDDNSVLVIELNNFEPRIRKTYKIGEVIDSVGSFVASYTDASNKTYYADGKNNTSGELTVVKITYNTFQGYFKCTAYRPESRSYAILRDGIFFARLKQIQ